MDQDGSIDENIKNELENEFQSAIDHFYHRRNQFYADRESMLTENVIKYENLLKEVEEASKLEEATIAFDKLKELQGKWKVSGKIDDTVYEGIYKQFESFGAEIYKRYTINKNQEKKNNQIKAERIFEAKSKVLKSLMELKIEDVDSLEVEKEKVVKTWNKTGEFFNKKIKEINNKFNYELALINEKIFISKLAENKSRKSNLKGQERIDEKVRLLKKLIIRDKTDLEKYQHNMEVFNAGSGKADHLLNTRLQEKERSLNLKNELLIQWKNQLSKKD